MTRYRVCTDDKPELCAALCDIDADRTIELTEDELEYWQKTGELPESIEMQLSALKYTSA